MPNKTYFNDLWLKHESYGKWVMAHPTDNQKAYCQNIFRHMSCLHPCNLEDTDKALQDFDLLLRKLEDIGQVEASQCDNLKMASRALGDKLRLDEITYGDEPLDEFYTSNVQGPLLGLVKKCLVLSHGQASVERGFSNNKEVSRDNIGQKTLVAQRLVCDHILKAGGVAKVKICAKMLKSVGQSRLRYESALQEAKTSGVEATRAAKRKACEAEILDLKDTIKKTKFSIEGLNTEATSLSFSLSAADSRPSSTAQILLVVEKSNALRQQAILKEKQLPDLEKALASKEAELPQI